MSVETVINSADANNENNTPKEKFPFETEMKSREVEYKNIFDVAEESKNHLKSEESFKNFFEKKENLSANEIIFSSPCTKGNIYLARKSCFEFLDKREILDWQKRNPLKDLIGEVIKDTIHSTKQTKGLEKIFNFPEFIVRLGNLNNLRKFNFEIINPDKTKFENWSTKTTKKELSDIENLNITDTSTGAGTVLKMGSMEELNGKVKYIGINEDGEKKYTSFYFTFEK